jgi:hypothetical protein
MSLRFGFGSRSKGIFELSNFEHFDGFGCRDRPTYRRRGRTIQKHGSVLITNIGYTLYPLHLLWYDLWQRVLTWDGRCIVSIYAMKMEQCMPY